MLLQAVSSPISCLCSLLSSYRDACLEQADSLLSGKATWFSNELTKLALLLIGSSIPPRETISKMAAIIGLAVNHLPLPISSAAGSFRDGAGLHFSCVLGALHMTSVISMH